MVNLIAPAAIIFVNNDLTDNVKTAIQRQLFITDTMAGEEFDARVAVDPDYVQEIHGNGMRVLVIRSFWDHTNRTLADIAIFVKAGLASVECNKFGPPGQTFAVDRMYLSQLFYTSRGTSPCPSCSCKKHDCLKCATKCGCQSGCNKCSSYSH